ncbi:MAG: hypothetical protein ABJB03_10305 [Rhodoglobus sp.]
MGTHANARLWFNPREAHGIEGVLAPRTPSILFYFVSETGVRSDAAVGAFIVPIERGELVAGAEDVLVDLVFWNDALEGKVLEGQEFEMWYGRTIGHGRIVGPQLPFDGFDTSS